MKNKPTKNTPAPYQIRVSGHLSANWDARFEGLSIRHEPDGDTILSGDLDQAALHGVLVKIRDLGLILISVNRVGATGSPYPGVANENLQTKGEMKNE